MNLSKLSTIWNQVLQIVKDQLQDNKVYDTFFQNSKLYKVDGDTAYISVKTKFAKELLGERYLPLIEKALEQATDYNYSCKISMESGVIIQQPEELEVDSTSNYVSNLNSNYTFENFVVGPSNQEAQSAALTTALEPGRFYNPLFIYGKSGIGKTHLLHAIGNYILSKEHNKHVYYVSSAEFLDEYVNAIRASQIDEFKESFKQNDVLLIDDIQFLSGKDKITETFFHIFNHLVTRHKQIVITSDRAPNELKKLEERLVSRFASGLSVQITAPEYETSLEILKKKIEGQTISNKMIKEDVLSYIALKYSKDIRQLEGALNRLMFYAESFKKQSKVIDLTIAQEALKGLVVTPVQQTDTLTVEKIKMTVADYYKLSTSQLSSSVRVSNISNARHIAMYLCRTLLDTPFIKIGDEFGGRDHSTVINACEKVEKLLKTDPNFKQAVEDIKILLR